MALPSLYNIAEEYRSLVEDIIAAEGELTPALQERWASLTGDVNTKVQSCGYIIRNMELAEQMIDTEIKRLQALKKQATNGQERLKHYVKVCMLAMGIRKVEQPTMTVSVATNPPKVIIDHEADIPSYFKSVEVKMPLDVWRKLEKKLSVKDAPLVTQEVIVHKSIIADTLKVDTPVPGAHLEQGTSLRIK